MKVLYSDAHRNHNPEFEIFEGGIKVPVFESPERMDRILGALRQTDWAEILPPHDWGLEPIRAVHNADYVDYLSVAFDEWEQHGGELGPTYKSPVLIPASFPPRRSHRAPKSIFGRAGYYTMDTNAPIVAGTFRAAVQSAHCAVTAAQAVADGERVAFALCRPPGHHAGRDYCGGYCFFNNAAIAARRLSPKFKTAILDIDYHAGNGTQDIFYDSADVLTISIHADPIDHYPSYMGYADEIGEGIGRGYHRNFPLPARTSDAEYLAVLDEALALIRACAPSALVLSAGMDIYESDPLGDFKVTSEGIRQIGKQIAALNVPTVICMEGGYNTDALGVNTIGLLSNFV